MNLKYGKIWYIMKNYIYWNVSKIQGIKCIFVSKENILEYVLYDTVYIIVLLAGSFCLVSVHCTPVTVNWNRAEMGKWKE